MAVLAWMRALALVAAPLAAGAAHAQPSLSPADVGRLFCDARLSGDMTAVEALLTPGLGDLLSGDAGLHWQGIAGQVTSCQPVGASGSFENPESVIFYRLADGASGSDRIVLSYIDEQLRIDDIAYGSGGTLRSELANR